MCEERDLCLTAERMRMRAMKMAYLAGKNGAHLGGGLSSIEILAVLYGRIARLDSKNPYWDDRDRILIGKAHCVLSYYTALHEAGFLSDSDLDGFEQNGTDLVGHPIRNISKGIEYSGGSLGMALSVAAGMALHARNVGSSRRIFVLVGDGECEEGAIWEAVLFSANYQLSNLVMIIDNNHLQYDGAVDDVAGLDKITEKLETFGWEVRLVDGHNVFQLEQTLKEPAKGKPIAIVADTVKGKGISFMENEIKWHHSELKKELYEKAIGELQEK